MLQLVAVAAAAIPLSKTVISKSAATASAGFVSARLAVGRRRFSIGLA